MAARPLSARAFLPLAPRRGIGALRDVEFAPASLLSSVHRQTAARLEVKACGNVFGNYFQVATYGESHGGGVDCVISGCPPQIPLTEGDVQVELDRSRARHSRASSLQVRNSRGKEGSWLWKTTSCLCFQSCHTQSRRYAGNVSAVRACGRGMFQSVATGGGRSSGRETIGRVAAGALAKKILKLKCGVEILAFVSKVHQVVLPEDAVDYENVTLEKIESNIIRCPDPQYADKMTAAIDKVRIRGDSVGGVVTCIARNVPRGLGSPVFDKLEAELSGAMLSIPASNGFEIGSGFADETAHRVKGASEC